MKILVAGDFNTAIHEQAFFNAFKKLGYEVEQFKFSSYLDSKDLFTRIQNKFRFGPQIYQINKDFLSAVLRMRPDFIFLYRGAFIFPKTLKAIRKEGITLFGYNNDDPFGTQYPFYFWRHFKKGIPYYDHIFVYRHKNIEDYKNIGYVNTSILRSYYIEEKNFPISNISENKYSHDVIFIGHYEDDGRDEYIKAIIENGIDFRLYGPEWRRSKFYNLFKEKFGDIPYVKEDYNLALNSAKISLVFLSHLNSDTYTRRCFEIPATKAFMCATYSDDLNSLFEEGKEAEYFKTKEELVEKLLFYTSHDEERKKIAEAGYARLKKDGHEVVDRAQEVINTFSNYKK